MYKFMLAKWNLSNVNTAVYPVAPSCNAQIVKDILWFNIFQLKCCEVPYSTMKWVVKQRSHKDRKFPALALHQDQMSHVLVIVRHWWPWMNKSNSCR